MKAFYVYLMTNRSRVVLYTGITNSLVRRVWQHQNGEIDGFTKNYKVSRLVYYERFNRPRDAIACEKEIKGLAARKEERVRRADESQVGGSIAHIVPTHASHFEASDGAQMRCTRCAALFG